MGAGCDMHFDYLHRRGTRLGRQPWAKCVGWPGGPSDAQEHFNWDAVPDNRARECFFGTGCLRACAPLGGVARRAGAMCGEHALRVREGGAPHAYSKSGVFTP